jgi:cytochrome c oxidase cbb3-type subunit III
MDVVERREMIMGEYDGIEERKEGKSRMPLGMTILFIGLAVSGLYYVYLFLPQSSGWTQSKQYQQSMEVLKQTSATHESKEVASGGPVDVNNEGLAIYKTNCAMCHGENLEGGIGPALTGPKFIYGGTLADHMRVIHDGTPNGMPAFGKQLGPEKVRDVAHYVAFRHTK